MARKNPLETGTSSRTAWRTASRTGSRTRSRLLRGMTATSDTSLRTDRTASGLGRRSTPLWVRRLNRRRASLRRQLARRWKHLRRATTPIGWGLMIAAIIGLMAGGLLGWGELLAIGVVGSLIVLASLLFLLGRPRFDVGLSLSRTRTTVGVPVSAEVSLRDRSRLRSWTSHVEVVVGDGAVELATPGRSLAVRELEVPALRRGVVRVGPVRSVRGDPIGLFRRSAEWSQVEDLYVHPVTIGLPPTSTGFVRDLEGTPTNDLTASDISFHALREYRPGDDPRHVAWKAVARTGQLMVRQFEETRRSHLVVAFGRDRGSWNDRSEFEMGLSVAASLGLRAIRDGRDITIVTSPLAREADEEPAREPSFVPSLSSQRLLDGMSEIEWASGDIGVGELAALAAATVPGISIVFLVVGSKPGVRELRSWSQRFPAGVQTVAIVCTPGQSPSMLDVSGLTVLRIGYLNDLRHALVKGGAS